MRFHTILTMLIVTAIFAWVLSLSFAHAAPNAIFRIEWLIDGARLTAVFQPKADQKCKEVDDSLMIPSMAKKLGQRILGEAYIPIPHTYVYWVENTNGGPLEVFATMYTIRECIVTEVKTEYREFLEVKDARQYYILTVKKLLEAALVANAIAASLPAHAGQTVAHSLD